MPFSEIDLSQYWLMLWLNALRPRQYCCHFTDGIFKCIFLNENVWIFINISSKFVPKGQINNIPALVQIMAWCQPGDKPLSEPMMVSVTQPQWVNGLSNYLNQCWNIINKVHLHSSGGHFKNTNELLNLRALVISTLHKYYIFQCMGKIFCVEFQRCPLKFHTISHPYIERCVFYWDVKI